MTGRMPSALLVALPAAAFFVLASAYGVVVPIFEAPDEVQHFEYVRHVALTRSLPVQEPDRVALYRQEGSQPPLYYILGAALTGWIDISDAADRTRENPHVNLGVPTAFGNKNAVVHDPTAEAFPWRGTTLAVHVLRLLSTLFGALTVLGTWALGRQVAPERPAVAVGAAWFVALLPQFLFVCAAVSNDALVAAASVWTIDLLVRGVRSGFTPRRALALGAVAGLAALSKLSGLAVVPAIGAGLAVYWLRAAPEHKGASRHAPWRPALLILIAAGVVAGWWYGRNQLLYGDPLGLRTMLDVAGRRDSFGWSDFLFELEGFRLSFWGVFGWFNVLMPGWAYRVLDGLALLAVLGWLVAAVRRVTGRKETGSRRPSRPVWLVAFWTLITLAALVRWTWSTTGSQGRLAFGALGGLAVLWALGLDALLPRLVRRPAFVLIGATAGAIALGAPFVAIVPAYARPPVLQTGSLPPELQWVNVRFGNDLTLLGYELPERRLRRGTELPVTLYWQADRAPVRDYTIFVHLQGRDAKPIGQEDTYPAGGSWPTSQWRPGQVVRDEYRVLVSPEAKAPALASVDVGVYDLETRERLEARALDGSRLASVVLDRFKLTTWAPPAYRIDHPTDYRFGAPIRLAGYRVESTETPKGTVLDLSLYWRADREPGEDYTVFVHLLDDAGRLVGQHDGPPVGGDYPTSWWDAGETVKDEHHLEVPVGVSNGRLTLSVGLYRPADGSRLKLPDGSDAARIPVADDDGP